MTPSISSVLVVGHPRSHQLQLGSDVAPHIQEAQSIIHHSSYRVIVLPFTETCAKDAFNFILERTRIFANTKFILCRDQNTESLLIKALQTGSIYRVLEGFDDPRFDHVVRESLEKLSRDKQDDDLLDLIHDRTARLDALKFNLAERVARRTRSLQASRNKLIETNLRFEALHSTFLSLYRSQSVSEMESELLKNLSEPLELDGVRIVFESQSGILPNENESVRIIPLTLLPDQHARIVFSRQMNTSFSKDENIFLEQVAEATGLALNRLLILQKSERLKKQWEATFDAILDPLCLTTLDHKILRNNKAFCTAVGKDFSEILRANPFEILFNEVNLPELKHSSFKFLKTVNSKTFEISGSTLSHRSLVEPIRWILFRDITHAKKLEDQLIQSAKMAELGTIGSSIAHELNNPIGGMLSFLQLIKMDLKEDDPHYIDIDEMEKATLRCKEIIENLLGFARKGDSYIPNLFDLKPIIVKVAKLIELSQRSMGVRVEMTIPDQPIMMFGQADDLLSAFHYLLQNACEAVLERNQNPLIQIGVEISSTKCILTITDNGPGIDDKNLKVIFNPLFSTKNPALHAGLGLTNAFRIITGHEGELEILSSAGIGTSAKITLKRPDLPDSRQEIDGKI